MNHIDPSRWQNLAGDELSAAEAEHLSRCASCEQHWQRSTTLAWLNDLAGPSIPSDLLPATVARFDHAATTARLQRLRAARLIAALLPALALLAWIALSVHASWFIARLCVLLGNGWALLSVAARLASHFPRIAILHLTALGLCAVLLALLCAQLAPQPKLAAPK